MPKEVRILGHVYAVIYEKLDPANRSSVGKCSSAMQRIMIASTTHKEQQEETLLHEVLHAVVFELDLDVSEKLIYPLASGLYAVLKDNPKWW